MFSLGINYQDAECRQSRNSFQDFMNHEWLAGEWVEAKNEMSEQIRVQQRNGQTNRKRGNK